jgi:predicted methyltransferase
VTSILKRAGVALCFSAVFSSAFAIAPDFMDKLGSEARPQEDRARDGARRPYQVMQLLGVEEGMTVVDVGAGGGWYTRVLSAAVGPQGKVISQAGPRALNNNNGQAARDMAAALGNVEPFFGNMDELEADTADVAVTALNMHHQNEQRAIPYLQSLYKALKPGGVAAVIDHVGDASIDNSRLHRIPPAEIKGWLEQVGFQIVEESDILRTSADDHTLSAVDPRLGRNTDRFLFVVRKPQ